MAGAAIYEAVEGLEKLIELPASNPWKTFGRGFIPSEGSWPSSERNTFGSMSASKSISIKHKGIRDVIGEGYNPMPRGPRGKDGLYYPAKTTKNWKGNPMPKRVRSGSHSRGGIKKLYLPANAVKSGAYMGKGSLSHPGELKYFDTVMTGDLDATGEILTNGGEDFIKVPQGTAQKQRIGNKAWITSLYFNGRATFESTTASAAGQSAIATIYIVLDTSCNKTSMTVLDVFTSASLFKTLHNLDNSSRFRILHKVTIPFAAQMGTQVGPASGSITVPVNFYLKFKKPIQIDYTGALGAIGERTQNNLSMIAGSNLDDQIELNGNMRIRYRD